MEKPYSHGTFVAKSPNELFLIGGVNIATIIVPVLGNNGGQFMAVTTESTSPGWGGSEIFTIKCWNRTCLAKRMQQKLKSQRWNPIAMVVPGSFGSCQQGMSGRVKVDLGGVLQLNLVTKIKRIEGRNLTPDFFSFFLICLQCFTSIFQLLCTHTSQGEVSII